MPDLAALAPELQDALDAALRRHRVPGAAVGVQCGEERVVLAAGVANVATGVEVTPDTLFQIGSIAKPYTATLVMQLVDAGLVELDEPVRGALQEFRVRDAATTLGVTPRQLLSHTSGIEGDHFLDVGRNSDALWRFVSTLDEVGQIHPHDELFSYCNAGYGVLGRLVEETTGDHFAKALHRRLLRPLRVTQTCTSAEQAIVHRVAAGHEQTVGVAPTVKPWTLSNFPGPIGGLIASAPDVLEFASIHLRDGRAASGKQVLSARSVSAMREPQVEVPGTDTSWGLGWHLCRWGATEVAAHDGDTAGQRAFLRVVPSHHLAVVVLTNSPLGAHVSDAVMAVVAERLCGSRVDPLPTATPGAEVDARRITGIYERMHQRLAVAGGTGNTLRMTVIPDELFAAAGMRERTLTLTPVDQERFVTTDPDTGISSLVVLIGDDRPDHVFHGLRAHRRIS